MVQQRLPAVNGDDGVWGNILNQYLAKEHYDTGADNAANGGHETITVRPGTTAAGTAPLKFTSGSLMTASEAGAVEFLTDKLYFTQTTGTTRKVIAAYDDTSGATGDVYYRNASGYFVRLGVGTTSQLLTVTGGVPVWADPVAASPGGGVTLIQAATAGPITLSGTQTVDDVALVAGDTCLVKNQASGGTDGVYLVAAGAWSRATGWTTAADYAAAVVRIADGTVNGGKVFVNLNFKDTATVGTTAQNWWQVMDALSVSLTYAPSASPAFTGTPTGITKTHVGLANVDNTSDANKPVSTAQQAALNLKAPLAALAGIGFTGDSWTVGTGSNGGRFSLMAMALSDQRLKVIKEAGISGQRLDQIAARFDTDFPPATLAQLKFLVIEGGINDGLQGTAIATTVTALLDIITKVRNAGVTPVVLTPGPQYLATPNNNVQKVVQWIRGHAATYGYLVVDLSKLADVTTGRMAASYRYDDNHVNDAGHIVVAKAIIDVLAPFTPPQRGRLGNSDADYGAAASRVMTGLTSGFPAGWSLGYNTATTGVTRSLVTVPGWAGSAWRTAVSAPDGVTTEKFWLNPITAGDWIEWWMRIKITDATFAADKGVTVQATWNNSGGTTYYATFRENGDYVMKWSGVVPAGVTGVDLTLYYDLGTGAGVAATINKGEFSVYTASSLSAIGVPA